MKVIYIAGPITNTPNYKKPFDEAEAYLKQQGYIVFNPAMLPSELTFEQAMPICYAMMDCCDTIFLLDGWEKSRGANLEYAYAIIKNFKVLKGNK